MIETEHEMREGVGRLGMDIKFTFDVPVSNIVSGEGFLAVTLPFLMDLLC